MRRINLLPPEERRRGAVVAPRRGVVGILLILGALVVLIMVGVYVVYMVRLNNVEDQIADLDQQIAQQNARLAELSPYRDLQARLDAKKPVADGIVRTRFAWDEFLQGLAFVIPNTTALEGMTATASPINLEAPAEEPLSPPGAVTFTGVSLPRFENVSDFVVQMNTLRYLSNSTLTSAELDRETFARPAINFEVASELNTLVGESGTELRIEDGTPSEVPDEIPSDQASASASARAAEAQYANAGSGSRRR
ncbi:MAG: hypothetical protein H0U04_09925 [Rubrobacter sp.]|nr:hypothetical protein [Rubrobacter sp.]